ncbi:hypothetical protein SELMODRAFT_423588 [Selaginella moellendorffii]|uniref:Leucine-rich repeat-containing N-terminal plant-type domain-containing protein n=1 Tax=Selaginella moellendorffii TaxID=88036 RepID=D8SM65_SELML|nr:hypothetical protein SELMODRAFT_423588 [Selaginella moellendorffii]
MWKHGGCEGEVLLDGEERQAVWPERSSRAVFSRTQVLCQKFTGAWANLASGIGTALVNMYGRYKSLDDANQIERKDVATWTVMSRKQKTLVAFQEMLMLSNKLHPLEHIFQGLCCARVMVPLEPSANLVSHGIQHRERQLPERMQKQEQQKMQKVEKVEILFWLFFALGLSQMLGSSFKNKAHALLEFKKGINDTQGTLLDWNPGNVANMCVWAGISCDSSTSVVSIRLTSPLLQGSISPSIGQLTQLRELNLSRPDSGLLGTPSTSTPSFPAVELLQPGDSSSLANCSSLEVINLSRNHLGDRIPESLVDLFKPWDERIYSSSIVELNLTSNSFNTSMDSILKGIQQMKHLQILALGGEIPAGLLSMKSFQSLDLQNNGYSSICLRQPGVFRHQLTSEIFGGDDCALEAIDMSRNNFSTGLSPQSVDLSVNNLQGTLREDYPPGSSMRRLDLSYNELSGEVPPGIGNLSKLTRLDLSNNHLSGVIPSELGRCSSITLLDLSSFQRRWTISILNVGDNVLTGEVTMDFGATKHLVPSQLGQNQFTGPLPYSANAPGYCCLRVTRPSSKSPEWYSFGGGVFDYGITLRGAYTNISNLIDSFTLMDFSNNELEVGLSMLKVLESLDLSHNNFEDGILQEIAFMPVSVLPTTISVVLFLLQGRFLKYPNNIYIKQSEVIFIVAILVKAKVFKVLGDV